MRRRAFTLVEVMVASAIAFIIISAGASLAAAVVRNIKRIEEQTDLGLRAAIVGSYLRGTIDAVGYEWKVQTEASSVKTGAWGAASCVPSTGICPATTILPLQICKGSTVSATTCDAPDTTSADALRAIVPRDALLDALVLTDRDGTDLIATCNASNVPASFTVKAKGVTSTPWAVGDLIMVTTSNHATVGTVQSALAAGGTATTTRTLTIDVGDGNKLSDDDGGASSCNAFASLRNARIFRVKLMVLKLATAGTDQKLVIAEHKNGLQALSFADVISDVDDLGFRFDLMRLVDATNAPSLCTSDLSDILDNATVVGGSCAGLRLRNATSGVDKLRIMGLQIGIGLRSRTSTDVAPTAAKGFFDRSATTLVTDTRLHRRHTVYAQLPSASAF